MKSKKQKNNLRKSKIKNNQWYLQSGGTLIYINYMGQNIQIDSNRIYRLLPHSRSSIADLKDNIYRWGLLPISIEQRFLMVISEHSIGECYDWVLLNDIIEHLGPSQRLQFTLTINPLAVNTIVEMFNLDRFHFTSLYKVNNGERNIILGQIIYTLFEYYSRYISDLRKTIFSIVTPPDVSTSRPRPRHGEFKIYIQTLTNDNYELMVLPTDTVYDIKLMIEKITEIRPHKARLMLTPQLSDRTSPAIQLEDRLNLANYNITANRILLLLLGQNRSICGCQKYVCESCIMSQMKIRCMIDEFHPEPVINQDVILRVSREIRETQNEIIHLTRVLDALRGQIPPTASRSSQPNPSRQQQSRVGPPSTPPPPLQSQVGPPSVPPPPLQSRVGPPPSTGEDRLISMGFDRERVLQALQLTNNNEQDALDLIIASDE
jgi:hypothetical protein